MTCAEIQADFSLYLYGELDFAAEDVIERHVVDCAFCQLALNREKQWHAAVNRQQMDVQPEMLTACRADLFSQIAQEPTTATQRRHRLMSWLESLWDIRVTDRSYRIAAVSFLLLVGFGAGRLYNSSGFSSGRPAGLNTAGLIQPSVTRVQEIQPEAGNRVRIILQQTQMREVSGNRSDHGVREILVGAVQNSQDPGVRIDSVEMLAGQESREILNTVLNTIRTDPNAAVRVKAIESLRKFPADAATRSALEFALAHDRDAGVRAEALDLLVPAEGDFQVTPQLMEIMADVLHSPQTDEYVRGRCAQVLSHQSLANDIY